MKDTKRGFFKLNYKVFVVFLMILIVFVPSVMYYFEWSNYVNEKKDEAYSIQSGIDEKISSVKSLLNYTFFDEEFQMELNSVFTDSSQENTKKIYERLTSSAILGKTIDTIWYFPFDENGEISADKGIVSSDNWAMLMPDVVAQIQGNFLSAEYKSGEYFAFPIKIGINLDETQVLAIGHQVLSAIKDNYLEPMGVCVSLVNLSVLTNLTVNAEDHEIRVGLYDKNGEMIYGNSMVSEAKIAKMNVYKISIGSKYFQFKTILYFDIFYVFYEFLPYLILVILILVLLSVAFISYMHRQADRKAKVYDSFVETFQKIREGYFDNRVEKYNIEELDIVGEQFNLMMDSLFALNKQLSEAEIKSYSVEMEKNKYVLKYLSTQINKHFIFNTFGTIRAFVNTGRNEEAATCIDLLCEYLRFTLKGRDFVTITEEINALQAYLEILKIRFKNIVVELDVDNEIGKFLIPQFILQPIVENAYRHAFPDNQGKISIKGKINKEGKIEFWVSDNGIGISRDRLEELNKVLLANEETATVGEIGLVNVQRRLKLMTGEDAYIKINSTEGNGTENLIVFGQKKEK